MLWPQCSSFIVDQISLTSVGDRTSGGCVMYPVFVGYRSGSCYLVPIHPDKTMFLLVQILVHTFAELGVKPMFSCTGPAFCSFVQSSLFWFWALCAGGFGFLRQHCSAFRHGTGLKRDA